MYQLCLPTRLPAYTVEPMTCQQIGMFCLPFHSPFRQSLQPCVGDEIQSNKPFVEGFICRSPGCDYYVLLLL